MSFELISYHFLPAGPSVRNGYRCSCDLNGIGVVASWCWAAYEPHRYLDVVLRLRDRFSSPPGLFGGLLAALAGLSFGASDTHTRHVA